MVLKERCKIFSSNEVKDKNVELAVNNWLIENEGKIIITQKMQSESAMFTDLKLVEEKKYVTCYEVNLTITIFYYFIEDLKK